MVAPAAAANAGMAAALLQHDRVRRSTELPLFYGRKEKDTITARNLIVRLETASDIAQWPNDARRCAEFFMILRDRALVWWETLEDAGVDDKNWNEVKTAFLKAYEKKYTAKTTCTNFADISQRQGEPVHDYFLRLQEIFGKLINAAPEDMGNVRMVMPAAIVADTVKEGKSEGIKDMAKFFKMQLFIAGLNDSLRAKVMEAGKASIYDCLDLARELETINSDRKRGSGTIAAISSIPEEEEEAAAAADVKLDDEEIAVINAIRAKKGKPPMRTSTNFRNGNNNNSKSVQCRYCKKNGHFQKDCHTRRRDRAPMVDAQGKPYQKRVNNIEGETAEAGKINSVSVEPETYPLNWM